MKKGFIELSLKCCACKQMRPDSELGCMQYSPMHGVTTYFRYCRDNAKCKEIAEVHKRDKLIS